MIITAMLKNWEFAPHYNVYYGDIFGDTKERFKDGTRIHTSDVKEVIPTNGGYSFVVTRNSVYAIRPEDARPEPTEVPMSCRLSR